MLSFLQKMIDHLLQIRVLQIRVLQIRVLQIQSSPCFTICPVCEETKHGNPRFFFRCLLRTFY